MGRTEEVLAYLYIYLFIANVFSFIIFGVDKRAMTRWAPRVSDQILFALAAVGGSIGALLGMAFFGNKNGEQQFTIGIPAVLVIQVAAVILFSRLV
ncbi:MAG TPA: DUF1294 domain-containing protein [Eubacteriales bacterium]|nr:DUF1294 domain-containing protein [Eubacteriales bacterium]